MENPPKAKVAFVKANEQTQELIRLLLKEERDVQHLSRRSDIHARIYEHIRRLIK